MGAFGKAIFFMFKAATYVFTFNQLLMDLLASFFSVRLTNPPSPYEIESRLVKKIKLLKHDKLHKKDVLELIKDFLSRITSLDVSNLKLHKKLWLAFLKRIKR